MQNNNILEQIQQVAEARKTASAEKSYISSLYQQGTDKILQKIGEEATETILAAKSTDTEHLIKEIADLWFHSIVLLSHKDLKIDDVLQELQQRFGLSGLDEKKQRKLL
ncbi:MAG: phosphoribosyl-ATP diphosphatase [Gammaproteobacteria bacterium]|nr:MAG: phosphoribosyl-ATP diphosphatase [Gammaproteobacteria bacterium]